MNKKEDPLIMIVDDNENNLQVLGNILEENGYEPAVFLSGNQALEFIQQEQPELILLDIMMPDMDGYDVCQLLKTSELAADIPVIFITGKTETEDKIKGFDVGGVDYVTKPFEPTELLARIKTHIHLRDIQKKLEISNAQLKQEISLRKKVQEELRELASTDYLTGLFNRRHFIDQASREFSRSKRYKLPMSLLMIDADHFKAINDTYGHGVGDIILKKLGATGKKALRSVDVYGRIGGEEFSVYLPDTCIEDAIIVAERFRREIETLEIPIQTYCLSITVSIGVAMISEETKELDHLMKKADSALYRAKENGRNRVETTNY